MTVGLRILLTGCHQDDRVTPAVPSATSTGSPVAVVGDDTAKMLAQHLCAASVSVTTDLEDQDAVGLIVIVQDGTEGVMPVHRTVVEKASTRKGAALLWVITNTDKIDDQELLELEELEARELLNRFGLPGDTAQFAFDSQKAPVARSYQCPRGWKAIVDYVACRR